MPTVLYKIDPKASFRFDSEATTLARQPELAVLLARVIAGWSSVESYIGLAATAMLGGRAALALTIYDQVSEQSLRYSALYASAREALSKDDADLFCAAIRAVRRVGAKRNILAHGVVGESQSAPNAIIVIEQRHLGSLMKLFFTSPEVGKSREDQVRRATAAMTRHAQVFEKTDLEEILREIDAASSIAIDCAVVAAPVHHNGAKAREKLRASELVIRELSAGKKHN